MKDRGIKYVVRLSYKGTNYSGWQRQPNIPSIQEVIENAFLKLTNQKVNIIGCGRTDAGVHAREYTAHVLIKNELPEQPVFKLNNILPDDISILNIFTAPERFHAQHSAEYRQYDYFIHLKKDPFRNEISSFYLKKNTDSEKIELAVKMLLRYSNFRAFCKTPEQHNHTRCNFSAAIFQIKENGNALQFTFIANRYLKRMIRLLVGNIMKVGYGSLSLEDFEHALKTGESLKHWTAAPPQGLFLTKVTYSALGDKPPNV